MQTVLINGDVFTNTENNQTVVFNGTIIEQQNSNQPTQEQIDAMQSFASDNGFTNDPDADWAIVDAWSDEETTTKVEQAIDVMWNAFKSANPFDFGSALKASLPFLTTSQKKEIIDVLFFNNTKQL